jgi:hypothetical protein
MLAQALTIRGNAGPGQARGDLMFQDPDAANPEAMNPSQSERECRAAQRFPFQMPVRLKVGESDRNGIGVTQNVSARGALFYTDMPVAGGSGVEFTLVLPSEVTLTENMRVHCQGKAVRVVDVGVPGKLGVAVVVERYEFLSDPQGPLQVRESLSESGDDPDHLAGSRSTFRVAD